MQFRDIFKFWRKENTVPDTEKRNDPISSAMSNPYYWITNSAFSPALSDANINLTEEQILTLSTVYACVNVIGQNVAISPLNLYKRLTRGKELVRDNPIFSLRPNNRQNINQFKYYVGMNYALRGNSYIEIVNDNRGKLNQLMPFCPDTIRVQQLDNGHLKYYVWLRGQEIEFYDEEIIHISGMIQDGYIGLTPMQIARNVFGTSLAEQTLVNKFFANGATPSAIIKTPNKLSPDARKVLRDDWNGIHQGVGNIGKIAILQDGIELQPFSLNMIDAQLIESRKFSLEQICAIFNVPPSKIQHHEKSNVSNVEQQNLQFYQQTMLPILVNIETSLNARLFPNGDYFLKFNPDEILRADATTRYNAFKTAIFSGVKTVNECREEDDLNPVEYGDDLIVQGAMIKLSDVGKNFNGVNNPNTTNPPDGTKPDNEDITEGPEDPNQPPDKEDIAEGPEPGTRKQEIDLTPIYIDILNRINAREKADICRKCEKNTDTEWLKSWLNDYMRDHRDYVKRNLEPYALSKRLDLTHYNGLIDAYLDKRHKDFDSFIENQDTETVFGNTTDILGELK